MWERFSTSGLAGSYLDDLLADGVNARMELLWALNEIKKEY